MSIQVKLTQNENISLRKWAQIVIEKWEFNISKANLIHTGDLLRSFTFTVNGEAGGDKALISFAFKYYLRMQEMGVGKGEPIGSSSNRNKHPVFTKTFYAELHRLSELMAKWYANEGANIIALGLAG